MTKEQIAQTIRVIDFYRQLCKQEEQTRYFVIEANNKAVRDFGKLRADELAKTKNKVHAYIVSIQYKISGDSATKTSIDEFQEYLKVTPEFFIDTDAN